MKVSLSSRSKAIEEAQVFTVLGQHTALVDTALCARKLEKCIYRQKSWMKSHGFTVFPAHWSENKYHPCRNQLPAHL